MNFFKGKNARQLMRHRSNLSFAHLTGSLAWASVRWLALLFSLLSLSACAWLDARQREFVYRPTPGLQSDFAAQRAGDQRYFVSLQAPGDAGDPVAQRLELWWLPHGDPAAPTLLYFHGTFRTLFQNLPKIDALRAAGFSVLAVEYRGWGLSTPITPSEQSILQDADAAWAELQRREPRARSRVLFGHSMGSGVAVDLASRLRVGTDYGGLVLESGFTSFKDIARSAGFMVGLLAHASNERFASIEKIGRVNAPLLMIHGSADTTVPLQLGAELFAAANQPKIWFTVEGGSHSDLQEIGRASYQSVLKGFIAQYLAPAP
jgi:pimeloyl-ACP methyl ester carboxylesterase